ncbi:MAG TPA: aspartate aminotransferase family protein [Ruminococcaceae bacterium]|nr:aspartate aminotransferase family protein [Oscillospiraceae bacterium]
MGIKELDNEYLMSTYNRFDVVAVSGKGSYVFDKNGKKYIDFGSGIGTLSFGIADEIWCEAVNNQAKNLAHISNLYYTEPPVLLAEALCKKTGLKKVFFSNSGAEANECAIKAARKYSQDKYGVDRYKIATLKNSFHGRTITTLSATGQEHYHELFTPLTDGFVSLPAGDIEAIKSEAKDNSLAAVMIECIQGEGGVVALDGEYVKALADFCGKNDILLIVDEVQTGNGRTGKLYAYMNYGITPDIVTTAKGLGGGLPIGATLFGEKSKDVFSFGDHGSTFGANPVSCAAAKTVIDRLDDDFLAEVKRKSDYIFNSLSGEKGIVEISGMGLMIGLKTEKDAKEVVASCMEKGLLCLTAKDKVRLLPALNVPFDLVRQAVEIIKQSV